MANSSTANALIDHITGVHNQMWQEARPAIVDALPFRELKTDTGDYNTINRAGGLLPDEADLPSTISGYEDEFEKISFEYGKNTITTRVRTGKLFTFADDYIRTLSANNPDLDPVRDAVRYNDGLAAVRIVRDFKAVADTLTATTVNSGTFDLTSQTLDYRGFIDAELERSDLAGQAINALVIGPAAARRMAALNVFAKQIGFAGGSGTNRAGNDRPARRDMYAELKQAHLDMTGVELIVDGTKRRSLSGGVNVGAYEFTTTGYFLCTDSAANPTIILAGDPQNGNGLLNYLSDRIGIAQGVQPGEAVSWTGRWGFNGIVTNCGSKVTLTLS